MVRLLCSLTLCFSFSIAAQETQIPSQTRPAAPKIPELLSKLKLLQMKDAPEFEETFNHNVKAVENAIEEEKLYCAGETADAQGKTVSKEQKPLCMRELKKQYLDVMDTVFEMKKKYLGSIHRKQIDELSTIQQKLKDDIQKNF
ncbi:MAG TPA: hypothetical protein VNJ01_03220 [Bacteriovoracaceae bacterium]|nr:hypothetical protein [Bacteriovoracaceae bacterium]